MGNLRTSDETYHQSWLPWVAKMGKIIADNEITKGGVSYPRISACKALADAYIADYIEPD
jgi:hypothetical protein